jgi:alkylation response protein AidB-like acyl-CoA dehydrogenase
MSDPEQLGCQLVFIPEAYGGMDGGAFDAYRVCEVMARKDIGLATAVFATFLGSDPIVVGATEEQKQEWLGAIAERASCSPTAPPSPRPGPTSAP